MKLELPRINISICRMVVGVLGDSETTSKVILWQEQGYPHLVIVSKRNPLIGSLLYSFQKSIINL